MASASPRRAGLLRRLGVEPGRVHPAKIDETPRPGEMPRALALRLACAKARWVAQAHPGFAVLAADTVVARGRRVLPKAEDSDMARTCLQMLSGRGHHVRTAVCLVAGDRARVRLSASRVVFKRLGAEEMAAYLALGEWRGKAGGYAIQGRAEAFVRQLTGSYSGVVGLPLYETAALLRGAGLLAAGPEGTP